MIYDSCSHLDIFHNAPTLQYTKVWNYA